MTPFAKAFLYWALIDLTTPLKICGEVNQRIHQNLLSRSSDLSAVKRLYAHAQSLAQCHEWLNRNLAALPRVPVASNAEGARLAADKKSNAQYYGQPVSVKQLLFDHKAPSAPAEAETFRKALP